MDCDNDSDEEWESACPLPPPETTKVIIRSLYPYVTENKKQNKKFEYLLNCLSVPFEYLLNCSVTFVYLFF